jgi:hypothetical protein
MELTDKDKQFEKMLDKILLSKDKKVQHEFKQWEEKAKGKHRQHQF